MSLCICRVFREQTESSLAHWELILNKEYCMNNGSIQFRYRGIERNTDTPRYWLYETILLYSILIVLCTSLSRYVSKLAYNKKNSGWIFNAWKEHQRISFKKLTTRLGLLNFTNNACQRLYPFEETGQRSLSNLGCLEKMQIRKIKLNIASY